MVLCCFLNSFIVLDFDSRSLISSRSLFQSVPPLLSSLLTKHCRIRRYQMIDYYYLLDLLLYACIYTLFLFFSVQKQFTFLCYSLPAFWSALKYPGLIVGALPIYGRQSTCCSVTTANWPDPGSTHKRQLFSLLDNCGEPVASSPDLVSLACWCEWTWWLAARASETTLSATLPK